MARKVVPLDLSPFGHVVYRDDTKKGRWVAIINYPNPIGVRKPSFHSVEEANEHLLSEHERHVSGLSPRRPATTISVLAEDWLARRIRTERLARRTIAFYREALDTRILPYWGEWKITQIEVEHVQDWIDDLEQTPHRTAKRRAEETPLSESMVRRYRQTFDQICREGIRRGMIRVSPAAADLVDVTVTNAEPYDGMIPVFTPFEIQGLWDVVDPRYRALIPLGAYGAGLRIGEWAGLSTIDFDPRTRELSFRRKVTDLGGQLQVEDWLKGRNPGRVIVLGEEMTRIWTAHVARHSQNGWVFPAPKGGLLSPGNFRRRIWQPAVQAIGRPEAKFHWLRHSNVSLLREEGVDLETVSKHVGHKSITTTERVYSHLTDARSAQVAEASERLLSRLSQEPAFTRGSRASSADSGADSGADAETANQSLEK